MSSLPKASAYITPSTVTPDHIDREFNTLSQWETALEQRLQIFKKSPSEHTREEVVSALTHMENLVTLLTAYAEKDT